MKSPIFKNIPSGISLVAEYVKRTRAFLDTSCSASIFPNFSKTLAQVIAKKDTPLENDESQAKAKTKAKTDTLEEKKSSEQGESFQQESTELVANMEISGDICQVKDLLQPSVLPIPMSKGSDIDLNLLAQRLFREVTIENLRSHITLAFSLEDSHLRKLGVKLRLEEGKLQACFNVVDQTQWELLHAAAPALEAALESKGIQVDTVEIMLDSPSSNDNHSRKEKKDSSDGDYSLEMVEKKSSNQQNRTVNKNNMRSGPTYYVA